MADSGLREAPMGKRYIRVNHVREGMFSSEKEVAVEIAGKKLTLLVDKGALKAEDLLEVTVVDITKEQALIDLPGEPFGGGARLFVPTELLVEQ
jgi:hypothetical protein